MLRTDLSTRLIHLTRGSAEEVRERFASILKSRVLRGSDQNIRGKFKCVCFTEAPLSALAHVLSRPSDFGTRYMPFGVMVEKEWLFEQGGRPAIYQSEAEYELLEERQKFRHVRYEPGRTDYSWEREWRIRTDELQIDPATTTVIVPTRAWEEWAQSQHMANVARRALVTHGFIGKSKFPWHFAVLEDLGIPFPDVPVPPSQGSEEDAKR